MKAGKLRALGMATPERSAIMPDVPTIAEQDSPVSMPHRGSESWRLRTRPARSVIPLTYHPVPDIA